MRKPQTERREVKWEKEDMIKPQREIRKGGGRESEYR
jgi:hypothetical protein